MLGILFEIGLTIWAWNRGWKWLSLIPMGIVLIIAFFVGVGIGTSGGSVNDASWVVTLDIMAIIALIIMVISGKKEN